MKYESHITNHSKDMANVKVFADRQTSRQTDGQAKNYMLPIFPYRGIKKTRCVYETQMTPRVTNSIESQAYIKAFEK
jgi:hypothetical protein